MRVVRARAMAVSVRSNRPSASGCSTRSDIRDAGTEALTAALQVDDEEVLAALAAERQREQRLTRGPVGCAALVLGGEEALRRGFQSDVGGVALADELVQLEREQRAALRVAGS